MGKGDCKGAVGSSPWSSVSKMSSATSSSSLPCWVCRNWSRYAVSKVGIRQEQGWYAVSKVGRHASLGGCWFKALRGFSANSKADHMPEW
eukprot:1144053-Pelagomonas_calceolata.AAC.4